MNREIQIGPTGVPKNFTKCGEYITKQGYIFQTRMWIWSSLSIRKRTFVVDSGASMHMMSNLDISLEEQETMTVSKTPTKAITADATTRTTDLAAVDVKELEMFVTVQLVKDHPAITYIWENLGRTWVFL